MIDLSISLVTDPDEAGPLAAFFVRNVDKTYISHGEIMDGRALNEGEWSPEFASILEQEFREAIAGNQAASRQGLRLAAARIPGMAVAGVAMLELSQGGRDPYAVIHDLVVAHDMRGQGIGTRLLQWLEAFLKQDMRIDRVFLESGSQNHDAHMFFQRQGFRVCSVNMLKELA